MMSLYWVLFPGRRRSSRRPPPPPPPPRSRRGLRLRSRSFPKPLDRANSTLNRLERKSSLLLEQLSMKVPLNTLIHAFPFHSDPGPRPQHLSDHRTQ